MTAAAKVQHRLQEALAPVVLQVKDDSHLHRHHAEGGSGAHLCVRIVSAQFEGLHLQKRHRLVYQTVGELSLLGVHALAITALTPAEAKQRAEAH